MNSTPSELRYLVIDQGGHATRAMLFNGRGETLSAASAPISTRHPAPDRVEHAPDEILGSTHAALQQCLAANPAGGNTVTALGIATQRSSIVCWDRDSGQAVTPVLSWQDRRAATQMTTLQHRNDDIHRRTGLFVSPHYGASKMRWCLEHLPAVGELKKNQRLIAAPLASFLIFRLLRQCPRLVDYTNAGRTLLFNLQQRDWDPALLKLFHIDRGILPDCVPVNHSFGHYPIGNHSVPCRLLIGDQPAALYARGQPDPATVYVNAGTGAFVQRVCREGLPHHPRLLTSVLDDDTSTLEGTVNGAGSALAWLETCHHIHRPADRINAALQTETHPPVFINAVGGVGSPYWQPERESKFLSDSGELEKIAAVVESVAFLIQANLDAMEDVLTAPQRMVLSGGFANATVFCQRLADLSGLPVMTSTEAEATAKGAAFLLAGQPDDWSDRGTQQQFAPQINTGLQQRYQRWREAMDQEA